MRYLIQVKLPSAHDGQRDRLRHAEPEVDGMILVTIQRDMPSVVSWRQRHAIAEVDHVDAHCTDVFRLLKPDSARVSGYREYRSISNGLRRLSGEIEKITALVLREISNDVSAGHTFAGA